MMNLKEKEFVSELLAALSKEEQEVVFHTENSDEEQAEMLEIDCVDHSIRLRIRIDQLYEGYCRGASVDEIAGMILHRVRANRNNLQELMEAHFQSYERVRTELLPCLMSQETNPTLWQRLVNRKVMDMVLCYMVALPSNDETIHLFLTKEILRKFGVEEEDLYRDSLINLQTKNPPVLIPMTSFMKNHGNHTDVLDEMMWIATREDHEFGATVLLSETFLEEAYKTIGGDFYILPSSVHELIFLKADDNTDFDGLREMVNDINREEVKEEERLSNQVYYYNGAKKHVFSGSYDYEA